jgi:predicted PurR-regulated permease PerM
VEKSRDETITGEEPDLQELGHRLAQSQGVRSFALTGLFVLACFYTFYFAREFFLPVVLALLLNFLLSPVVRGLARVHIPEFLGAALVLIALLGGIAFLGYEFSGPVNDWIQRAPEIASKLQKQVRGWTKPVQEVSKVSEQVGKMTNNEGAAAPRQVELKPPGLVDRLLTQTWTVLFQLVVLLILLYFLLASGDLFLRKLIKVLPRFQEKRAAVEIANEIESSISRYLFTVALINLALGAAASLAFWLIGLPTPSLWGLMGGLLNFIPYLGALTTIVIVTIVATATIPNVGHALLAPLAYLALGTLEANLFTPWVMGRRLTLNPVMIFVSLILWGWIWGIAGALLAVPILTVLKIICDRVEPLAAIGEFLGK